MFNGQAAIEAIESFNPDMAVIDFAMPEMDGVELAEHLRQHREAMPIIMLTAKHAWEVPRNLCDLVLHKPVGYSVWKSLLTPIG